MAPFLYYTPSNTPHNFWEAYQLIFPEETHEYVRKGCGQTNPDGTLALHLAPDLRSMLVSAKPVGKRAAQFFVACGNQAGRLPMQEIVRAYYRPE